MSFPDLKMQLLWQQSCYIFENLMTLSLKFRSAITTKMVFDQPLQPYCFKLQLSSLTLIRFSQYQPYCNFWHYYHFFKKLEVYYNFTEPQSEILQQYCIKLPITVVWEYLKFNKFKLLLNQRMTPIWYLFHV